MPSAVSSKFRGGAGFLRNVDGTILDIQFGPTLPGQSAPSVSAKGFHSLFGVLTIQQDGKSDLTQQALFVGDAEVFGVTEDGRGVTGTEEFSRNSGWGIFLDSLNQTEFDISTISDEDPTVADFTPLIGSRMKFDQRVNDYVNKTKGKRKDKTGKIDPRTKKVAEYDNTDLIVTSYYGHVEVEAPKPVVKTVAKPAARVGKKVAAPVIDVAAAAAENIILALAGAKNNQLVKARLGVKLIQVMQAAEPTLRDAVREWSDIAANLSTIEGVTYDPTTQLLSLDQE